MSQRVAVADLCIRYVGGKFVGVLTRLDGEIERYRSPSNIELDMKPAEFIRQEIGRTIDYDDPDIITFSEDRYRNGRPE